VGRTLEGLSPLGVLVGLVVIVISPSIQVKERVSINIPFERVGLTCSIFCGSSAYDPH
jgi:hypothetical protein